MKKILIITISLSILVLTGVFGIGIENVFATVCNQTIKVEEKDGDSIYIKGVTIAARPDFGIIIIKCKTDILGECVLEGLLEHTLYNIIVEQSILPAGYECDGSRPFDCETEIVACVSQKTFKLKKITPLAPVPVPIPVFQANNLVDLTSKGADRNNDCVNDCLKVPCYCECVCKKSGECCSGSGDDEVCVTNYTEDCKPCKSDAPPCPKNKINDVFNSLGGHYENVENNYNIILKSFEQIRNIDAPSIKDSYRKINSLEKIDLFAINKKGDSPNSQGEYYVNPQNEKIFDKLNYCRSKMNLCFSRLHEYEVIEKEEVVREILIPCQIGKYEYLTGAENCYGFDMEHLDRAENLLCYHQIEDISLDELAEEEEEKPEPEQVEPNKIIGWMWTISVVDSTTTKCCNGNKKNCEDIDRKDCEIKCCQRFYSDSAGFKLLYTETGAGSFSDMLGRKTLHSRHNCLGY